MKLLDGRDVADRAIAGHAIAGHAVAGRAVGGCAVAGHACSCQPSTVNTHFVQCMQAGD